MSTSNHHPRLNTLARAILALSFSATGLFHTAQAIEVSQEPIGRGAGLPPNVMFVLDDSGSMDLKYMPDNLFDYGSVPYKAFKNAVTIKYDANGKPITLVLKSGFFANQVINSTNGFSTIGSYPYGHYAEGRVWWDSKSDFPKNLLAFNPAKEYPVWATGTPRESANAPLERYQDDNQFKIKSDGRGVFVGYTHDGTLKQVDLQSYLDKKKSNGTSPLPPLCILKQNEATVRAAHASASTGADDPSDTTNYFCILFHVDMTKIKNGLPTYEYKKTTIVGVDEYGEEDSSALAETWPENRNFQFIDSNRQTIKTYTPKQLFENYLNYLTYHNTRLNLAKGSVMEAFAERDENLRAGFTRINAYSLGSVKEWVDGKLITRNLDFEGIVFPIPVGKDDGLFKGMNKGDNRYEFFRAFERLDADGGTPLRSSFARVGDYYANTAPNGPYGGDKVFSCRQNIAILATDGYYDDYYSLPYSQEPKDPKTGKAIYKNGNIDGQAGPKIRRYNSSKPAGEFDYQYIPSAPYWDGKLYANVGTTEPDASGSAQDTGSYGNTLADIAMYYWARDLVPDPEKGPSETSKNNVPVTSRDPAFWQHMRTYGISFGVGGTLDPTLPAPGLPGAQVDTWPGIGGSYSNTRADDLWHATVNGRGQYFTVTDGFQLTSAIKSILDEANPGKGPGSSDTSSAYLFTDAEKGNILQFSATYNAADLSSTLRACPLGSGCSKVSWDAATLLDVRLNDKDDAGKLKRPRTLLIHSGGTQELKPFTWDNLNASEKQILAGNDELGKDTVRYLSGDTSLDNTPIANPDEHDVTNPVWRARAEINGSSRRNVLGMVVHGTPTYIGAPEDIRSNLKALMTGYDTYKEANKGRAPVLYAAANDGMVHAFVTQKTTLNNIEYEAGDELFAFMPSAAISTNLRNYTRNNFEFNQRYILDGELNYSEVNIDGKWKTVLVGSMGYAGISPAKPAVFALDVTDPAKPKFLWEVTNQAMGQTMGRPVIAPVGKGKWSVFLGAGPNNQQQLDQSAVLQIDIATGKVTVLQGDSMAQGAGIIGIHVLDTNKDAYADTVYAGDLSGNFWKIANIDGHDSSTGPTYTLLLKAGQPITAPATSTVDSKGVRWLFFGTGKALVDADLVDNSVANENKWFGIQDTGEELKLTDLKERTYNVVDYVRKGKTVTAIAMNYAKANDMNGKKGWYIPLVDRRNGAQVLPRVNGSFLLQNRIRNGLLFGQMNISQPDELTCDGRGGKSRLMVIDPFTGAVSLAMFKEGSAPIDANGDGKYDKDDTVPTGGTSGGGTGGGNDARQPIVGLPFGSGETSGSILITQTIPSENNSGNTGSTSPNVSGQPKQGEITASDSLGEQINARGGGIPQPPTTHSWMELTD